MTYYMWGSKAEKILIASGENSTLLGKFGPRDL
jgi:hypothetical protein